MSEENKQNESTESQSSDSPLPDDQLQSATGGVFAAFGTGFTGGISVAVGDVGSEEPDLTDNSDGERNSDDR